MNDDARPAIAARALGHRYGSREALAGIDFTVARGARYAVLGPNGSGKSTLFKLLATILPVQQGELSVLGVDLREAPGAVRARMGVVFQSPAVDRRLTVRQNLAYGGALFGLHGAELAARIDEVLARTGLTDRASDRVDALSGGLRRRVELAKCMLHRPELLLLDEPTSGLDPSARRELWALLRGDPDLTVVFATHLLEEAEAADRVLILHEGRVVAEGTPGELSASVGSPALEVAVDQEALPGALVLLATRFGLHPIAFGGGLRAQAHDAHLLVPEVYAALGSKARRVSVSPPSLLDVFFARTGAPFPDGWMPPPAQQVREGGRR
ncbi:MAG TPA: ABC transporter ATP-binding protein [Planctomycetota bacterium]|nr:ABC transporter ATP-binding protein [Planctomycetota bacterium]